ncbi:MAG: YcxB family protein [Ignavibacteriales bacterium]
MRKKLKTETKVTLREYKKMTKSFPYKLWKRLIIVSVIITAICSLAFIPPDPVSIFDFLLMDGIFIVCAALIIKTIDVILQKHNYKKFFQINHDNVDYKISFYDDYFQKESINEIHKIKYNGIKKIKETDDNFYLLLNNRIIIIILKQNCTNELLEFIKNICIKNNLGNNSYKNIKEYLNKDSSSYRKIKKNLIALFILTILSPYIGSGIVLLLEVKTDVQNNLFTNFTDNMWVMFLFLPIPILSIILGFIYRKKGVKCTKNIVGGFIIAILLITYGSFTFMFNFETNYSEISSYEKVIGIDDIPTKGKYIKTEWSTDYLINHITNYVMFTDSVEIRKFKSDIEKSNNWILKEEINSNLYIFIPNSLICQSKENCYYSVYIEEINSYNTIPEETDIYHIFAMAFNPKYSSLQIEDFEYIYKK